MKIIVNCFFKSHVYIRKRPADIAGNNYVIYSFTKIGQNRQEKTPGIWLFPRLLIYYRESRLLGNFQRDWLWTLQCEKERLMFIIRNVKFSP